MQFEDPKKKYEITFEGIRNKGCGSTPMFKFSLSKPVQTEGRFDIHSIREIKGVTGIRFVHGGEISKKLNPKGDVLLSVTPEALEYIQKTHEEELNKVKEEAKKDPETWRWWEGCDTGRMYISPNTELGWEFREDLEKVKDVLEKEFYSAPEEFYTGIKNERDCIIVTHEVVMAAYNKIIENRNAKKAAKQEEKDKIFAKAKETGEKQIIESYSVECNDPDESCDVDIITVYAMPDGSTTETRNHTW